MLGRGETWAQREKDRKATRQAGWAEASSPEPRVLEATGRSRFTEHRGRWGRISQRGYLVSVVLQNSPDTQRRMDARWGGGVQSGS